MNTIFSENKILKLFSSCIPVKGVVRSVIYDLQREGFDFIPNDLFILLKKFEGRSIGAIYDAYGNGNRETVTEYLQFLLDKEYIYVVESAEEAKRFPKIDLTYESYHLVQNAIIEYNVCHPYYDIQSVIEQLEDLNCRDLELRLIDVDDLEKVITLLRMYDSSCIQNISLVLNYEHDIIENIGRLSFFLRLHQVIVGNSSVEKNDLIPGSQIPIIYTKQPVLDSAHCGFVHPSYFQINMDLFKESMTYNNCLHRKISIDQKGEIRNCPSSTKVYANINEAKLITVMETEEFSMVWNFKKDLIVTCKVCEFRYMCSDCRVFTENNEPNGKPLKCTYNPFTGTWN